MIDFTKRDLYSRESKKMEMFRNNILVKESERNAGVDYEDDSDGFDRIETSTIVDSEFDFGGDDFDLGFGDDGFDFGGGGDLFGGDEESDTGITQRGDLSSNQEHLMFRNPILRFITSPIFLFYYVVLHTTRNNMKLHDWKNELEMMKKVNIMVIFTAILFVILEGRTIISPWFQVIAGALLLTFSVVMLKVINGEFKKGEESEESDELDFGGDDEFDTDLFGGDSAGFSDDISIFDDKEVSFDDTVMDFDDGENDFFEETPMEDRKGGLPKSPISVEDDDSFERDLSMVFKQGEKHIGTGSIPKSREEILKSFGPYLATNFTRFGEWKVINETSISYINVAFTLFLALEKINNKFGKGEKQEDGSKKYGKMYINDIKENTMMYRIEIELPEYFKLKNLTANKDEFHNVLKASENDSDVDFLIATFRQGFVIKLFKPAKQLISLGDMLRYEDPNSDLDSPMKQYLDPKKGLPVLLGIKNNEFPVVVDYEDNTSGVIVGGSGSGKSWFTFEILENFLIGNDYHNLQMLIFDKKNAPFWNQYALAPHVIGYHIDTTKLLDICNEVYAEIDRRKALLNELGAESIKGLRAKYRKKGMHEELKRVPLLLFIVDEITSTMAELEEMDEKGETYKSVKNVMAKITQEGRSLGVRMIAIGQRSIDKSIPKNVMANSSFKFGMKLDAESDFTQLGMENEIKKLGVPKGMGVGILKAMNQEPAYVKTVTVGGTSDEQILNLIRAMALDWNRRSIGDEFVHETTNSFKVAYNRDRFREKAMGLLSRGEIIPAVPDRNLMVDIHATPYSSNEDVEDADFRELTDNSKFDDFDSFEGFDDDKDLNTDSFGDGFEVEDSGFGSSDNLEDVGSFNEFSEDTFTESDSFGNDDDFSNEFTEFEDNDDNVDSFESEGTELDFGETEVEEYLDEPESVIEDEDYTVNTVEVDETEETNLDDSFKDSYEDSEDDLDDEMDLDDLDEEEFGDVVDETEETEDSFEDTFGVGTVEELGDESKDYLEEDYTEEDYEEEDDGDFDFDDVEDLEVEELDNSVLSTFEDIQLEELRAVIDEDISKGKKEDDYDEYKFTDSDFDTVTDFEEIGSKVEDVSPKKPSTPKPNKPKESKVKQVKTSKYKKPETGSKKMKRNVERKPENKEGSKPISKGTNKSVEPKKDKGVKKDGVTVEKRKRVTEGTKLNPKTKETPRPKARPKPKREVAPVGGVMFDPGVGTGVAPKKRVPMTKVKRYIIEHGEPNLTKYKIKKEELREQFDAETIGEALDTNTILSLDEDYFVTKI